jgi:hydrogenase nickel incorporation protein HypA/HybF
MHEMSLAMSLIEQVERCLAGFSPQARVVRITLEVGRLRAVVPDAMRFSFQVVSEGTAAEGAELVLEDVPVRVRCEACDKEWNLEGILFSCPDCGAPVRTLSGRELVLRSIEVDE